MLWDAQGNEVHDTFRIRSNPDLFCDDDDDITFDYEEMAFKVRDLSGSEVTALELISAHHYAVKFSCLPDEKGTDCVNRSSMLLLKMAITSSFALLEQMKRLTLPMFKIASDASARS